MPTLYIKITVYNELIKLGHDPTTFINDAAQEKLIKLGCDPAKFQKQVKHPDHRT